MDQQIYPVGTKLRVTKNHSVGWAQPWSYKDDVVTVVERHPVPHMASAYEAPVDIYTVSNANGAHMAVRADYVEPVVKNIPKGTLVFVTETHGSTYRSITNYAGTRLEITGGGSPWYTARVEGGVPVTLVHHDKIALVEGAPEKLTPPRAPNYVALHDAVVYHEEGNKYEGYWRYNTYWGWSNFVASNPELYREPKTGEDMQVNGTLAKK